MARLLSLLLACVFSVLLSACSSGPPTGEVRESLQQLLDSALGGRVLAIRQFTPAGGAPLKDGKGRLVYFNAALALERDYDFTQWDTHNVATLAALLGAGPKGVFGVKPEGNRAGDEIGVYGSSAFERTDSGWRLQPRTPPAEAPRAATEPAATVSAIQPRAKEELPPTAVETALAQLSAVLRQPSGSDMSPAERDEIVLEETQRALAAVRQRMSRAATDLALAAGPSGGAYEESATALAARAGPAGIGFRSLSSEGSVGNVRLLRDRNVQFALMQSDLAGKAYAGEGRFAGAPQPGLRAVASLFPETIHVVAASGAGIQSVADLRGKRVNVGPDGSGTRANANAIMEAHGFGVGALAAVGTRNLPDAAAALQAGEIDALFGTIHAPSAVLQRLAASGQVTFVPIGPSPQLVASGLVPLTLPARSYSSQEAPLPTLAATALMVTRDDVADAQIDRMLGLLFDQRGGPTTAAVSQIAVRTSRIGVTVPWHPRADANLSGRGSPSAPGVAAPTAGGALPAAEPDATGSQAKER